MTEKLCSKIAKDLYDRCHECDKFDPDATFTPLEYKIVTLEQECDQYKKELQTAMKVGADLVKGRLMPFKKQLRDLEAERDSLKEQLKFRESMDQIIGKRIEAAEAEVKQWKDLAYEQYFEVEKWVCNDWDKAIRLAKVQEWMKYQRGFEVNKQDLDELEKILVAMNS